MDNKDKRWAKQYGDFAEATVMYVMGQLKNMSIALVDHAGADLFASTRGENTARYAISVKGRNFPSMESKNYTFDDKNQDYLIEISENFGMEPVIALVIVDEQEGAKKIRVIISKLSTLKKLALDDTVNYITLSNGGITFRLTQSKKLRYIDDIKNCSEIDYTELSFTDFNSKLSI